METNGKQRIVAWVSLVFTGAVLVGAVQAADQEFMVGVLMAFLSIIMITITIVLFATSSKTSTKVAGLPAQPTKETKRKEGLRRAAKALFIFGGIFAAISIFMVLWAWYAYYITGELAGSGGMGGIIFLGVLVVTVPATLIVMFFALILYFAGRQK